MTIKLGIVMDPISDINIVKDSSFAMLLAAQKRGWELYYMELKDLYLEQGVAKASLRQLTVKEDPNQWYTLSEREDQALTELDTILMRKDPPFDSEFLYSTLILSRAEEGGVLLVNNQQGLRDCNEKLFATQFPQCCPDVLVSRDKERLKAFFIKHKDVIFKPLDGMGGVNIFRVKEGDANIGVILETLTQHETQQAMAQKFIPEITEGDKRILLIDGEPVPYGLARIPAKGENRGNLAAGGRGEGRPLTDRDRWICEQVGPVLKAKGLLFVGIDVIGDYLTEINVTSPTCIRELDRDYGLDIAGQLMDKIEEKLNSRR
ncbi:glutathione synthase [Alkalimarinus sediminis]|uniref:Glutathione synthetase n=1 Tax=Alkalimarinus sediminis TaxID=1632866 RepID=A0A9E8KPV9_9ALTE|nr:glutathione synthase [Alkalimarinus sediminis]UZW74585.1 glutathione synthase [Alkalimarinus sediminis]